MVSKTKDFSIGVDIGGTNITIAIVDKDGAIKQKIKFPLDKSLPAQEIIKQISFKIKELPIKLDSLNGIGIGNAGLIDRKKGKIIFSPNLKWRNVDFVKIMKQWIGNIPLVIENDANAAAWGGYIVEFKRKVKNLICLTLGTGIGGGIIFDGKIYRGSSGMAGEIGHMTLYPEGLQCKCGNYGCVERYVGGPNIASFAQEGIISGRKSLIKELVNGDLNKITAKTVSEAAEKGDDFALEIWNNVGRWLGTTLAGVINLLNPQVVLLSGGVARAGDLILNPVKETIKIRNSNTVGKDIDIKITKLQDNLGVVGAAMLVR